MKNIKLISIVLIIILSAFLGCVKSPASTPTPTATPTVTETIQPTVVPTTPSLSPTPTPTRKPLLYKAFVDQDYGFKRVIEANNTPFVYDNLTLNIHTRDTVMWINDAVPDEKLTVMSEQNLWNESKGLLRWNYQFINYTFTQPGTYGVYVKEFPRLRHQKIIVNP